MNHKSHPHLLVIAHGSRSGEWNAAIEEFVSYVNEVNHANASIFSDVSCCYLEHAEPSILNALKALTVQGNDVIAVPFFLAPGLHVRQDVPKQVKSVGSVIHENQNGIQVQYNGSDIELIPHYSEAELLAQNALRRVDQYRNTSNSLGLILVYYGSKRHSDIWDDLTQNIESRIKSAQPKIQIKSLYAGDAVAFSPQPTIDAISELSSQCSQVIILPMLLAVGVIQTDVIPNAIRQSEWRNKVIYHQDSVLPDKQLAEDIWIHAQQHFNKIV